ncbi:MAG: porin family protein, partial [Odoribacteraceae bacterium]|nr:porin family protein [Odoribacteraceae bacterium]
GVSFWQNKDGGTGVESGPTLFVEGRYNVLPLPVNVGLHVDISTFRRIREDNDYEKPRSLKFVIAGDYNLRRGKLVNPFAGIGVGIALDEQDFDRTLPSRTGACLVPRAGVRLLGHIVLALDYEISRVSHNHFDFKMGFCF